MTYRAIYKDKYEYEFRINPLDNSRFDYKTYNGDWKDVGLVEEYSKNKQWEFVYIH